MRKDRDPIIAALAKHKPSKFEVELRDGSKKTVTLSTKANRWQLLSETLDAMAWVTIEAQDQQGNVLGAIEREGDWEDDLDPEIERGGAFAKIILNAVTATMVETRKMFTEQMKANTDLIRSVLDSQHVLVESYSLALKVQATAMGQNAGEEPDKVMELVKMAAMLKMGGTPSLTVTPPTAPAKPAANGVAKKTA